MTNDTLPSRLKHLATIGDYGVDATAILALAFLAQTYTPESNVQILAGAITSVALGKRYLQQRVRGGE